MFVTGNTNIYIKLKTSNSLVWCGCTIKYLRYFYYRFLIALHRKVSIQSDTFKLGLLFVKGQEIQKSGLFGIFTSAWLGRVFEWFCHFIVKFQFDLRHEYRERLKLNINHNVASEANTQGSAFQSNILIFDISYTSVKANLFLKVIYSFDSLKKKKSRQSKVIYSYEQRSERRSIMICMGEFIHCYGGVIWNLRLLQFAKHSIIHLNVGSVEGETINVLHNSPFAHEIRLQLSKIHRSSTDTPHKGLLMFHLMMSW